MLKVALLKPALFKTVSSSLVDNILALAIYSDKVGVLMESDIRYVLHT